MTDKITVTLSKPVEAHGETVKKLAFREATGGDIAAHGYPFTIAADGALQPNAGVLTALMAALADVPPSTIKALTAGDWNACMGAVLPGFLGEAEAAPSMTASTSPTSSTPTRK